MAEKSDYVKVDSEAQEVTYPSPQKSKSRHIKSTWQRPRLAVVFSSIAVLFALGYLFSYALVSLTRYGHAQKRINVILMISDGFGQASESLARSYIQYLHNANHPDSLDGARWSFEAGFGGKNALGTLPLDRLVVGSVRTRSSNSLVTDSAAGATSYACGQKTYNGGIAVDPVELAPLGTVLEAAKHKGYLTGLVATSRITHATPAAFFAHVVDRDMESKIAEMLLASHPLGRQVDYALGGGRCFFLPNSSLDSCRKDNKDILADAAILGKGAAQTKLFSTRQEFDALLEDETALGTIGLFSLDHLEYEVDRIQMPADTQQPSLLEMSQKTLNTLSKSAAVTGSHGFFAMIEGSRIDMAGHSNDPVGHLYDILAYQETVRWVKKFVDDQTNAGWPTLLISVADHETGGLSLANQLDPDAYPDYLWYPDALVNATSSTSKLGHELVQRQALSENDARAAVQTGLGIFDLTTDEVRLIQEQTDGWALDKILAKMISNRAQIGWTTHGHSGVDVALHAYGYRASELKGNIDNTQVGQFIAEALQLDLSQTTRLLERTANAWHTKTLPDSHIDTTGVQHFHGQDAFSHGGSSSHLYLDQDS